MKNKINIILACIIVLFLFSCHQYNEPEETTSTETRGLMEVEVLQENGLNEDKMKTVRFIVFNNSYNNGQIELNTLFPVPDASFGQEVSKFKILLEVKQKAGASNTKMVVAIINEPDGLTSELDAITSYNQLINVELNLATFLHKDHMAIDDNKLMPMTGVIVTDKIYATLNEAEADPAKLSVNRALARVDIYFNKLAGLDIELGMGTKIELENTYDKQYLLRHQDGSNTYGKIQTVTAGWLTKTWALQASDSPELPVKANGSSGRLACSFYTTERTCTAAGNIDKLILNIQVVTSEGTTRRGKVVIDRFRLEGVETGIHQIIRNNIYKVITTVGANELTSTILDWNNEDIYSEF